MTATAEPAEPAPDAVNVAPRTGDWWARPRTAAEIRDRLRAALLDELGDMASSLPPRSPAEILYLADEYLAQALREAHHE